MNALLTFTAAVLLCGWAGTAQAQTSISTTGAGGTVIRSNGTTIRTNGAGGTAIRTAKASAASAADRRGGTVVLNGNNARRTIACTGNAVTVNGNNNHLLLTGTCTQLSLYGNGNSVSWTGAAPSVRDIGNKNVTGPAK